MSEQVAIAGKRLIELRNGAGHMARPAPKPRFSGPSLSNVGGRVKSFHGPRYAGLVLLVDFAPGQAIAGCGCAAASLSASWLPP